MSGYTEAQVEEMVQEAVARTEKSFGGTFKRLKAENEELRKMHESSASEHTGIQSEMEQRITELENELGASRLQISELAVRGEVQRQLRETGPLPEEFIDVSSIQFTDDEDALRSQVADVIEKGRHTLARVLDDLGITVPSPANHAAGNPTNPPSRDTKTAHDLKQSASQQVLRDMMHRGMIR